MKQVTLFKIVEERMMVGDHDSMIRMHGFQDVAPVGRYDVAAPLETSVREINARIERVRFPNGGEVFRALHPRDKEKISSFVEQKEINALNSSLESYKQTGREQFDDICKYREAGFWTRVKWLFTGVKIK